MGIKYDYELEMDLLSTMLFEQENKKELLASDYFEQVLLDFDRDWGNYRTFLNNLADKGFLRIKQRGTNYILCFGPKAQEWRQELSRKLPKESGPVSNQTNFNITATNVNAAGGDMTVTMNNTDLERLVNLLNYTISTHPKRETDFAKIKEVLDSGKSFVEIIKNISSLFG